MLIYTNHTRFSAIVTVRIESTDKPDEALHVGQDPLFRKQKADKGWHDLQVDAGMSIEAINNTIATVLGVRQCG
jgi:hypothetical protein